MNLEELMVTLKMLDIPYAMDRKYFYIKGCNFDTKIFLRNLLKDNNIKYKYEYLDRYWGAGYKIKKNYELKNKIKLYFKKYMFGGK
jgi:hypothetical protein